MSDADRAFTGSIPELYDRYMGPMLFEPFALEFVTRFKGVEGALLETAAGTGRVTRALAESASPLARITATDLNEPMLQRAASVVAASNIAWQQADAQALPFPDGCFDAALCQFGVMFFPDKIAAFSEARRVLKPGGRFVFSVWDDIEANDIARTIHNAVGSLFPDDPPTFVRRIPYGYHDPDRIRAALAAAGFGEVRVETVTLETPAESAAAAATGLCMGSPLRGEIEARRPGGLDVIVDAVAEVLRRAFGTGAVTGTGQSLVVTAHS